MIIARSPGFRVGEDPPPGPCEKKGTDAMTRWVKPEIHSADFAAQLGCACACGALAGAGSGQAN